MNNNIILNNPFVLSSYPSQPIEHIHSILTPVKDPPPLLSNSLSDAKKRNFPLKISTQNSKRRKTFQSDYFDSNVHFTPPLSENEDVYDELTPCSPELKKRQISYLLTPDDNNKESFKPSVSFSTLLQNQNNHLPDPHYLKNKQSNRNSPLKRKEFVEFIINLNQQLQYFYHTETIYLAINYFDRYLSQVKVTHQSQFKLLAITCFYLAGKFGEETNEPSAKHISRYFRDAKITVKDIERMEKKILRVLNWQLYCVTPHSILSEAFNNLTEQKFSLAGPLQSMFMSKAYDYLLQAILDPIILSFPPSIVAVTSLGIALEKFSHEEYIPTFLKFCNIPQNQYSTCHSWFKSTIQTS